MNKKIINIVASATLTLLVGCQVVSGERTINQYSADAAITTNVKAALIDNDKVSALPIHVETDKGTVILSGFVKTSEQKIAAGQAASKIKGVKIVKNDLVVRR